MGKIDGVTDVQTNVEAKTVVVVTADDSVSPQGMLEKLQKVSRVAQIARIAERGHTVMNDVLFYCKSAHLVLTISFVAFYCIVLLSHVNLCTCTL